jgi:chromosomal replication initiation ATPase DnaA
MMSNNFDPYDALVELNQRLVALEKAHNKLAFNCRQHEEELTITLQAIRNLQRHFLNQQANAINTDQINKNVGPSQSCI